jgi:hypothetical protein
MLAAGYPSAGLTHSAGATLDANGTTLSATGLAAIACFDDGSGEPHQLFAQIRDLSEPVDGLLLNVQLLKGNKATNSTDPISGDGEYSPGVVLEGGPGIYYIMVNKTGPGPRAFDVVWHCETADNFHTGTSITVLQFQ